MKKEHTTHEAARILYETQTKVKPVRACQLADRIMRSYGHKNFSSVKHMK